MQEEFLSTRRSNLIFIFLIVINLFFLTSHLNVYIRTIRYFLYYIVSPTSSVAEKVIESGGHLLGNVSDIVRVHQDNMMLRKELERYSYLEKEFDQTREENDRLTGLLNLTATSRYRPIIARVVERESSNWFEWIGVDKGSTQGLTVDAPVVTWIGGRLVAVGRVWEVYGASAKIILVTNNLCSLSAEIRDTNEDGLVEGQSTNILRLNYLLPESRLKPGDEVVTSSISQVFPSLITIGYVKEIFGPTKTNTLKMATVRPAFTAAALKEVVVFISRGRER